MILGGWQRQMIPADRRRQALRGRAVRRAVPGARTRRHEVVLCRHGNSQDNAPFFVVAVYGAEHTQERSQPCCRVARHAAAANSGRPYVSLFNGGARTRSVSRKEPKRTCFQINEAVLAPDLADNRVLIVDAAIGVRRLAGIAKHAPLRQFGDCWRATACG
jgi:hypothetical protein